MGRDPSITAWELPQGLRDELRTPLGTLLQQDQLRAVLQGHPIVCVGDITTLTVHRLGLAPRLAVVDFRTKREDRHDLREELRTVGTKVLHVASPAGRITAQLWEAIVVALHSKEGVRIEVDGEEDLATLPVLLEAPAGTKVVYGMPNKGVVVVTVDAASVARARHLIDQFVTVRA